VKLCRLEDADEHEGIASPSANDLDQPSLPHGREDGVLFSTAVADIPEDIASHTAFARRVVNRPRRVGQASRSAICGKWLYFWKRFAVNVGEGNFRAVVAAELPRANDENPDGLDVHQDGRQKHVERGSVHCP